MLAVAFLSASSLTTFPYSLPRVLAQTFYPLDLLGVHPPNILAVRKEDEGERREALGETLSEAKLQFFGCYKATLLGAALTLLPIISSPKSPRPSTQLR